VDTGSNGVVYALIDNILASAPVKTFRCIYADTARSPPSQPSVARRPARGPEASAAGRACTCARARRAMTGPGRGAPDRTGAGRA